ncbi:MAG TPA: OB-fold nucleic acid binding domain-containing protein, partial [Acidimicrobiales bacterium]|nr:OB-fold nucleic acid binding domain-containing protein [Acidimicrobiales bacterium]
MSAEGMRTDWCGELTIADAGREVVICGWVATRREHGEQLAFVDVRDRTGVVQCVVPGAHELRSEYVVKVTGTVAERPEGTA